MFSETLNLWKTLLEHRSQNFFEDTFRSIIIVEHRWILKATVNRPISSREVHVFIHTIPFPGRDRRDLPQEVQWQIYLPSLRYYQSNKPITLICVFVKISTNPSPRVRSWPWRLHESEIRVQGNQMFSFLVASCLSQSGKNQEKPLGPGYIPESFWKTLDTWWRDDFFELSTWSSPFFTCALTEYATEDDLKDAFIDLGLVSIPNDGHSKQLISIEQIKI